MCTRFSFIPRKNELISLLPGIKFVPEYDDFLNTGLVPKYNIPHEAFAHIISNDMPGTIQIFRWGFVPANNPDLEVYFYNYLARSDRLFESVFYSGPAKTKRCLILADGFVEWNKNEHPPKPFRTVLKDESIFAFAGIYDTISIPKNNLPLKTFAIITTHSNPEYLAIHSRMPVVLEKKNWRQWLFEDDLDKVKGMLQPIAADKIYSYEITSAINDPNIDRLETLKPKPSKGGQLGIEF